MAICATTVTAIAAASTIATRSLLRWACRRGFNHPYRGGTARINAAVAMTESANPQLSARNGARITITTRPAPRTAGPARRPPMRSAITVMAPMTPARTTLGSGRTRIRYPASTASASATRTRTPTRIRPASRNTAPTTMATFPPETAIRCASPASRMSMRVCSGNRVSSPIASPAMIPPAAGWISPTAVSSASRMRFVMRSIPPGSRVSSGAVSIRTTPIARVLPGVSWAAPRTTICAPGDGSVAAITGSLVSRRTGRSTGTEPPEPSMMRAPRSSRHRAAGAHTGPSDVSMRSTVPWTPPVMTTSSRKAR